MTLDPHVIPVERLEIVGYADAFDALTVPRRVPPVFRFTDQKETCVFPPYRLVGRWVLDGAVAPLTDFEEMTARRRATPFPTPLRAEPDAVLWIDEDLNTHYGPKDRENDALRSKALLRVQLAEVKYRQGDYSTALQHARWASAAAEDSLYAILVEAASLKCLLRTKGSSDDEIDAAVSVLRDQAQGLPDAWRFDQELQKLLEEAKATDYSPSKLAGPSETDPSILTIADLDTLKRTREENKMLKRKMVIIQSVSTHTLDQVDIGSRVDVGSE
ncbi:MAG: hypothetical protein KAV00_06685 [Phycisphaerae bacterium]|nr:hypothetical protein [Phycisphaerae bacterium]